MGPKSKKKDVNNRSGSDLKVTRGGFPVVRFDPKGPIAQANGVNLAQPTGPIKLKRRLSQRGKRSENGDTSNDDNKSALGDKTLSALSKQFRGFLGPAKSNANYKVEKKDDRIDDGELSALSKAFRNFLPLGAPQKKEE